MTETTETTLKRFEFAVDAEKVHPRGKEHVRLARSDILQAEVQVIQPVGGETNLHSHSGADGFWFVLSGTARFYDSEHDLFAEVGPNEGVFVPRGAPYWFQAGDEELRIIHVAAKAQNEKDRRTNFTERTRKPSPEEQEVAG